MEPPFLLSWCLMLLQHPISLIKCPIVLLPEIILHTGPTRWQVGVSVVGGHAPLSGHDDELVVGSLFITVDGLYGERIHRILNHVFHRQCRNVAVGHEFVGSCELFAAEIFHHQQRIVQLHILIFIFSVIHDQLIQLS